MFSRKKQKYRKSFSFLRLGNCSTRHFRQKKFTKKLFRQFFDFLNFTDFEENITNNKRKYLKYLKYLTIQQMFSKKKLKYRRFFIFLRLGNCCTRYFRQKKFTKKLFRQFFNFFNFTDFEENITNNKRKYLKYLKYLTIQQMFSKKKQKYRSFFIFLRLGNCFTCHFR